jgi:hypothetical protein
MWRTYRDSTQTKGKIPKPKKTIGPGGSEVGDRNAMFFNILAPLERRETYFTKKLWKYEEPCEERVYLLVLQYFLTGFLEFFK